MWLVQKGAIALFATSLSPEGLTGTRRYLFTVQPGEVMFGCAVASAVGSESKRLEHSSLLQWLAVPTPNAEIQAIHHDVIKAGLRSGDPQLSQWVERWILQVASLPMSEQTGYGHSSQRLVHFQANCKDQAEFFHLEQGQTFQLADAQPLWLQLASGRLYWMGLADCEYHQPMTLLPLQATFWLEAAEATTFSLKSLSMIRSPDMLLSSIAVLNRLALNYLARVDQQEQQQEWQRFQARVALNRQSAQSALLDMATILDWPVDLAALEGSPLLVAMGAIGRQMAVPIVPPARSENLERLRNPLEAIGRASRLRMRAVLLRDRWWQQDSGPLLAYRIPSASPPTVGNALEQAAHPVAVLPTGHDRYELFDPSDLSLQPITAKLAWELAPIAYTFYRPLPASSQRVVYPWTLLQFALRGRGKDLAMIALTGLAVTLLGMLTPLATGLLIDIAIPDGNLPLLLQLGGGLLMATLGAALFQLSQGWSLLRLETAIDHTLQPALWDRLLNLNMPFFRQYATGDLQSRVTAITGIRQILSNVTLRTVLIAGFSLLNLVLMLAYSPPLVVVAVGLAAVSGLVSAIAGLLTLRQVQPLLELEGNILGLVVQMLQGIAKLRIAGAETRAFAYWGKQYSQRLRIRLNIQQIEDGLTVFNAVMPTVIAAVLFQGAAIVVQNPSRVFSTGMFLAFYAAFGTFIGGVVSLSSTLVESLQVISLWRRAQPILTARPEVDASKADPGRLRGSLRMAHVTFRYRADGPLTLSNISLTASPGEFIALVGPSGSGKSTIFRLLLGFDAPTSGTVYYDGQDLAGLDIYAVRRQLGVVLQNSRILSASLFENIAAGALITLEEAWEAARMAGFAQDILAMPMEMHTVISEGGSNLSGGQRQRLLIARALALKPRILLFDEATSALDNRTQAIVAASLAQLKVTRVAIAHRLSTIRQADRIYVLQSGQIVQQGNFEQLSQQPGLFQQLMARQIASAP